LLVAVGLAGLEEVLYQPVEVVLAVYSIQLMFKLHLAILTQ
jgi:hypothetical protein